MSTELKPCPLCRSTYCDVIIKEGKKTAQCVCLDCGLTARPVKVLRMPITWARDQAVLVWNTRTTDPLWESHGRLLEALNALVLMAELSGWPQEIIDHAKISITAAEQLTKGDA